VLDVFRRGYIHRSLDIYIVSTTYLYISMVVSPILSFLLLDSSMVSHDFHFMRQNVTKDFRAVVSTQRGRFSEVAAAAQVIDGLALLTIHCVMAMNYID
jgi:hypothetical protein